jgi:hypothetical protein
MRWSDKENFRFDWHDLLTNIQRNVSFEIDEFLSSLPDGQEQKYDVLNYNDGGRTVLNSSIEGSKHSIFSRALELGAKLTAKELNRILMLKGVDPSVQKALFSTAMQHVYSRLDNVTSLDDELFYHVYQIESYLKLCKSKEFREYLILVGFPETLRDKVSGMLHRVGIGHEEFIEKLKDFERDRDEDLTISPEGKEYYRSELLRLSGHEAESVQKSDSYQEEKTVVMGESDGSDNSGDEKDPTVEKGGLRRRRVGASEPSFTPEADEKTSLLSGAKSSSTHHQDKVEAKKEAGYFDWFFGK